MNREAKRALTTIALLLVLASLACGLGDVDVPDVGMPDGAAATAEGAAQAAATAVAEVEVPAGAVQTAQAAVQDGGGLAATAVALAGEQGGQLVATLEASNFEVDANVDLEPLRQKVANAQPDANGNITVTFTDDELNQAIDLRAGAAGPDATPAIQEPELFFSEGNVVLVGTIQQPIQGELRATFQPVVADGQLRLFLVVVEVAGIPVPTALLGSVEATINTALATLLSTLPSNYSLSEVIIGEGTLTLTATRN